MCNANYFFKLVVFGDSGRNSDGGLFSKSKLGHATMNNQLNLSKVEKIPGFKDSLIISLLVMRSSNLLNYEGFPRRVA